MQADLWVFGYGSLMWRPGFDYAEASLASIRGYRRALCIYSHVHRGTPDRPGLVLGLDRGGACKGMAFRIPADDAATTHAYLRARELVTNVYLETHVQAALADGRTVTALAYVADRRHAQYAGTLDRAVLHRLVAQGVGEAGRNVDYVRSTQKHLLALGIRDATLSWLADTLPGSAEAVS